MRILELSGIEITFPLSMGTETLRVVGPLDLAVDSGEIVGLAGVSGVGKSSVLRIISGELKATGGEVKWHVTAGSRCSFCRQEDVLLEYRNAWENVLLLTERGRRADLPDRARVNEILEDIGLVSSSQRFPAELSGGTRQRVQVMQAMMPLVSIALLDEPFSHQDFDTQLRLEDWLWKELKANRRAAVIVSHDVEALGSVCDRVLLMGGKPATVRAELRIPAELAGVGGRLRRQNAGFRNVAGDLWRMRTEVAGV